MTTDTIPAHDLWSFAFAWCRPSATAGQTFDAYRESMEQATSFAWFVVDYAMEDEEQQLCRDDVDLKLVWKAWLDAQ